MSLLRAHKSVFKLVQDTLSSNDALSHIRCSVGSRFQAEQNPEVIIQQSSFDINDLNTADYESFEISIFCYSNTYTEAANLADTLFLAIQASPLYALTETETLGGQTTVTVTNYHLKPLDLYLEHYDEDGYEANVLIRVTESESSSSTGTGGTPPPSGTPVVYYPSSESRIQDLADVNVTSLAEGQILKYDFSENEWVNASLPLLASNGIVSSEVNGVTLLSLSNSLSVGSLASSSDVTVGGDLYFAGSQTKLIRPLDAGVTAGPLTIQSNGDLIVELDENQSNDDPNLNNSFVVKNGANDEVFKITEEGVLTINNQYSLPDADGSANYFLKTDGSGQLYFATQYGTSGNTAGSPPPVIDTIDELLDTQLSALADNQILRYDSSTSKWVNEDLTLAQSIGDLTDVDTTTTAPTNGQALVWNNANSEWEPGDVGVDGFSTYVDPSNDDVALWQSEIGQTLEPWGSTIGNEEYQPRATFLSPDGSKLFFLGDYQNPDEIFQYTLNTPYDLSTIDSSTKVEVVFLGSGTVGGGGQEGNTYGLHIANDPADTSTYGKRFYIIGSQRDEVQEYTATTAWDLSTINTTATAKFYVGNQDGNPSNLRFSPDGTKFFVVDFDNNTSIDVRQYDMSTAWDITTASHNASKDVLLNTQGSRSTGLDFNLDGSKVFLIGNDNPRLHQYSLSTNYDLTTASLDKTVSMENLIDPLNEGSKNYQGGLYYDRNSDYVYITRWYANLIYRVNRNTAKITSTVSFEKGIIAEKGLYVKNHGEFSGSLHSSSLNTGGITCAQVNFNSLYNASQFYTTSGQMHIMSPYLRFAQQYNSSYGIKLIPDLTARNTQAVDVALPTQSGKIKVDTELYYVDRYNSEAAVKLKSVSDTELYYTARSDGQGEYIFNLSENPTAGQTIQRNIYYSDKAFADPATSGDWTQLTSFSGSGASFDSTKTEAYNQLNNRTVGTVPLSIKTTISNAVTSSLRNDVFQEMDLALGLRLLNPAYTGACIRVENDSNVEADIGFVNGVLDTTSLLSHCGSGDGYVVKIYDQSQGGATGSGNDATHANNSLSVNKPQIVSSGSVLLENGKPCMSIEECQFLLDSQKDYYAGFNLNMVVSSEMTASNQGMIIGDSSQQDIIWFNSTNQIETRLSGSRKTFSFSGVHATTRNMGQLTLSMWKESDDGVYLYVNNASSVSSHSTSSHFGVYRLFNGWNSTHYDFVGKFQELVFWGSALSSAERALSESNINTYYSVY